MPALWWFIEDRVAGMGRPGFNRYQGAALSLEEAIVFSWLGKLSDFMPPLSHFWQFLEDYGPKIALFHEPSTLPIADRLAHLRERAPLLDVLECLNGKTQVFENVSWHDEGPELRLNLTRNMRQLEAEIDLLKRHRLSVLISLIEQPFDHDILREHFTLYHVPIQDITPPSPSQVYDLAGYMLSALNSGHKIAVHCLFGVGRTTTMLIAAHLAMGYALHDLKAWTRRCNPQFLFRGSQAAFIDNFAQALDSGCLPILHGQTKYE
jgi:protein-tyrosine phosphatase